MRSQSAEFFLPFHIRSMLKAGSHKGEIHSQSARQVRHSLSAIGEQATDEFRLVTCCRLARTLLQRQAMGVMQFLNRCPRRHFHGKALPTLYLAKQKGGIGMPRQA